MKIVFEHVSYSWGNWWRWRVDGSNEEYQNTPDRHNVATDEQRLQWFSEFIQRERKDDN